MASSPPFNFGDLDNVENQMLQPIDNPMCCCSLNEPQEHRDCCVFHLVDLTLPSSSTKDASDVSSDSASPSGDPSSEAKRRKHRESMARLRRTWRTSIATLQREERHLQGELHREMTARLVHTAVEEEKMMDPVAVLRHAYCELVQEQLHLQDEQMHLEAARAHKEKYDRLLQRELERARTFQAIVRGAEAVHHPTDS